jgi:hypothetical protein
VAAFDQEANLLRTLHHAAIPRVVDSFTEAGRCYLVMDRVEGEDLEERFDRVASGKFPETLVRRWAAELLEVLTYLHGRTPPIVFRDLKPANIMVDAQGGLHLVDFGIAKIFAPAQKGTQIGTPGYAAPEQYGGHASPRSDLFALGATIYHLLTGDDPAQFAQPYTWNWALVPPAWVGWLKTALAYHEADRFTDAAVMKAALPSVGTATSALAPPPPLATPPLHAAQWRPASAQMPVVSATGHGAGTTANPLLPIPSLGVALAKYPVTNAEYAEFVRATRHAPPQHWLARQVPSGFELHPVVWVSLADAQAYCAWRGLRLPTDTEWLAAAQGGDGQPWPWGPSFENKGNFDQRQTTPVDWFPDGAGPCGHVDMAGNVWEWTATPLPDGKQIVKGGSAYGARPITDRGEYLPDTRNAFIGFRVCR